MGITGMWYDNTIVTTLVYHVILATIVKYYPNKISNDVFVQYTVVRKFFDRKYFIDEKIRGKIFSLMHDFLEIFLPWTYIASDNIYAR